MQSSTALLHGLESIKQVIFPLKRPPVSHPTQLLRALRLATANPFAINYNALFITSSKWQSSFRPANWTTEINYRFALFSTVNEIGDAHESYFRYLPDFCYELIWKVSIYNDDNYIGAWWLSGKFDVLRPKGSRFEYHSSRHVGTLGKSFTRTCL